MHKLGQTYAAVIFRIGISRIRMLRFGILTSGF